MTNGVFCRILGAIILVTAVSAAQDSAVPKSPEASEKVLLGNHFRAGFGRRYRVKSTMATTAGRQRSSNPSVDAMLPKPKDNGSGLTTVEFVEEEKCLGVRDDGVADISYQCLSFTMKDELDGKVAFECSVRDRRDLPKVAGVPRVLRLGALVEEPVRFSISKTLEVVDVVLPKPLEGPAGNLLRQDYKKSLQSRYQAFFPSRPVGPGDEWSQAIPTGEHFFMTATPLPETKMNCKMRFIAFEQHRDVRCARLETIITIDLPPGSVIAENGYQKTLLDSLEGKSQILFDIVSGTPMSEETTVNIKMRRVFAMKDMVPIETPIAIDQTIRATWEGTRALPTDPPTTLPSDKSTK